SGKRPFCWGSQSGNSSVGSGSDACRRIASMTSLRGTEKGAMQLTVRDVGKFLNVSEATVTRCIKQRGLPAQHVGGQYRFHRTEVLEWATSNQIKVSVEMFDHLENEAEAVPSLAEALEAGGVFHH